MNELVTVRNTLNGGVARVRREIVEHPVLGANLEIVPEGSKPRKPLSEVVREKTRKEGVKRLDEAVVASTLEGDKDVV